MQLKQRLTSLELLLRNAISKPHMTYLVRKVHKPIPENCQVKTGRKNDMLCLKLLRKYGSNFVSLYKVKWTKDELLTLSTMVHLQRLLPSMVTTLTQISYIVLVQKQFLN